MNIAKHHPEGPLGWTEARRLFGQPLYLLIPWLLLLAWAVGYSPILLRRRQTVIALMFWLFTLLLCLQAFLFSRMTYSVE
jgi:4-amino-4-deoxy-L-arabinose transferase-like glycosyltransferase